LRRASAAVSFLLLAMVTVAIAEATLAALLVLFSYVLRLDLTIDLGSARLFFESDPRAGPVVELYGPATVASILFCAACGLGAATRTFRRWRPTR
jgi:hypothetical protein